MKRPWKELADHHHDRADAALETSKRLAGGPLGAIETDRLRGYHLELSILHRQLAGLCERYDEAARLGMIAVTPVGVAS